jgi:hypothetical protein
MRSVSVKVPQDQEHSLLRLLGLRSDQAFPIMLARHQNMDQLGKLRKPSARNLKARFTDESALADAETR